MSNNLMPTWIPKPRPPFFYQQKILAGENVTITDTVNGPELSATGGSQSPLELISPSVSVVEASTSGTLNWKRLDSAELPRRIEIVADDWHVSAAGELDDDDAVYLKLARSEYEGDPVELAQVEFMPRLASAAGDALAAGEYYVISTIVDFTVSIGLELEFTDGDGTDLAFDSMAAAGMVQELSFMCKGRDANNTFDIYHKVNLPAAYQAAFESDETTTYLGITLRATGPAEIWADAGSYEHVGTTGPSGVAHIDGVSSSVMPISTLAMRWL